MANRKLGLFAELRRKGIASLIDENGAVTVSELCEHFSVSPATVRNDLTELEELGMLQRTHGGAIRKPQVPTRELTTAEKETQNVAEKRAIARAALAYIHPGDVIALDSGTTTYELAKLLTGMRELTVITNDLHIADLLERESDINISFIGGSLRRHFHCTIGSSIPSQLKNMYINTLFLATNGLSIHRGFSTATLEMAEVKRAFIKMSGSVVALADSSKANRESFVSFAGLSEVRVLITDAKIDPQFADAAEAEQMQVVRAE